MLRHIPCLISDRLEPDLLYKIQIVKLNYLQQWNFHYLKTHERRETYNAILLSVPAYHNLTAKYKPYEEVSRWNGKEMKEMSRYLLGVVTQSPQGGSPAQHAKFYYAFECT
jgi:hypothetical protein